MLERSEVRTTTVIASKMRINKNNYRCYCLLCVNLIYEIICCTNKYTGVAFK